MTPPFTASGDTNLILVTPPSITNRKSYMGFRYVPKSVTSYDPERRKAVIWGYCTELGSFGGQLRQSG